MGKIGDLWVRLGLKSQDFDKGIADAQAKAKGFSGVLTKVKGLGVAAWLAIGAAAAKMALDFVNNSNKLGDEWDKTMARVKAGWQTFVTALTSWNWDDFFGRMKTAADAAAKLTATRDREMEVENSIKLRKSEIAEELELLQIQARNQKLSYKEREEAARQYLDKVEGFYNAEAKYRDELKADTESAWLTNSGIADTPENRKALEQFLGRLETDTEMMKQLQNRKSDSAEAYKEYVKWANSDKEGESWKRMSGILMDAYNNIAGRDETNQALVDAIVNANIAQGAFFKENRRIFSSMNSAGAQGETSLNSNADSLRKASENARKAIEDSFKTDKQLLEQKYGELRKVYEQNGWDTLPVDLRLSLDLQAIDDSKLDDAITRAFEKADEAAKKMGDIVEKDLQAEIDAISNILASEEPFQLADQLTEELLGKTIDMESIIAPVLNSIAQGFSDSMQEMFDAVMGLEDIDGSALLTSLLKPLAQTVKGMGELLIVTGLGMTALKQIIAVPWVAIAAGAAMVALGAAATAGLNAMAQNVGHGAAAATPVSAGSYGGGTTTGGIETSEMVIRVEGVVKGGDILIAGEHQANEWSK